MSIELKGLKGLGDLDGLLKSSKKNLANTDSIILFSLDKLVVGKYQPRTEFDDKILNELAESIKENGVIQPIIVRQLDSSQHEIIAGERRWRAAKIAGLTSIPAIVRNVPDNIAIVFSLIENIQREDLSPIDQAVCLEKLSKEFFMTHEKISEVVGLSRSAVSNLLRLLSLTDEVKDFLKHKKIEIGHAKVLLILDDCDQKNIANQAVEKKLSVRETEKLVQQIKKSNFRSNINNASHKLRMENLSKDLSKKMARCVTVRVNNSGEGKIEVQVNSFEDIEWFINHLEVKLSS